MNKKASHLRGYWLNIMVLLGGVEKTLFKGYLAKETSGFRT
ncbi:hypothetical protein [Klebsiella aerogenes]|jgi:hypothetical protein|nr:hypothetical protein [Klebsiella aerogenes]EUL54575.1 hypothetical protein P849_01099 [Klebsiella aerogenes UCI 46]EUM03737.1 hypothetical protein P819_00755 [Klebsiella aerogenes UCI 16]MDK6764310.1 hypothetical protein [Klebsiella aerogenes]MDQ8587328.1 hypothetical protein [Klebsiella aerogenes]OUE85656.1 hypothetical protein AZZ81_001451 [Klebsiella aerogenes]